MSDKRRPDGLLGDLYFKGVCDGRHVVLGMIELCNEIRGCGLPGCPYQRRPS